MRKFIVAVAVALIVVPTASAGPNANAADRAKGTKTCNNIEAAIGARAFNELFAPLTRNARAADRNCARRQTAFEHRNRENPEWKQACEALKPPPENPPTDANAYGQCVAQLARAKSREEQQETINAAQQCKRERRADPVEFRAAYGGKANAFAQCVHQKKAANDG